MAERAAPAAQKRGHTRRETSGDGDVDSAAPQQGEEESKSTSTVRFKDKPVLCKICKLPLHLQSAKRTRCANTRCERPEYLHQICLDKRMKQANTVKLRCHGCGKTTKFNASWWRFSWAEFAKLVLGFMVLSWLPYFLIFYFGAYDKLEPPRLSHMAFSWIILMCAGAFVWVASWCCSCSTAPVRACLRCCRRPDTSGYDVEVY